MRSGMTRIIVMLGCLAAAGAAHAKDAAKPGTGSIGPGPSAVGTDSASVDLGGTPSAAVGAFDKPGASGRGRLNASQTEQTNARGAVERGEARPLGWLLRRLGKTVPGEVVKVRLRQTGGQDWIYDVTVLNASGRYVQVSLNAATGAIISKVRR